MKIDTVYCSLKSGLRFGPTAVSISPGFSNKDTVKPVYYLVRQHGSVGRADDLNTEDPGFNAGCLNVVLTIK